MNALEKWHDIMRRKDPAGLADIVAADCVFHSPVVHTPQAGRDITVLYLQSAMQVFNDSFRYVREVVAGDHAVLEFECDIDGILINGVDIISFDDNGEIVEFKVMVRPLKAINMVHARMAAMLEQLKGAPAG